MSNVILPLDVGPQHIGGVERGVSALGVPESSTWFLYTVIGHGASTWPAFSGASPYPAAPPVPGSARQLDGTPPTSPGRWTIRPRRSAWSAASRSAASGG